MPEPSLSKRPAGRTKLRSLAAWLGVFSLLVQLCLPIATAFPVLADNDGFGTVRVICTAYGLKLLPENGNERGDDGADSSCPICPVTQASLDIPKETTVPGPNVRTATLWPKESDLRLSGGRPATSFPRGPPPLS